MCAQERHQEREREREREGVHVVVMLQREMYTAGVSPDSALAFMYTAGVSPDSALAFLLSRVLSLGVRLPLQGSAAPNSDLNPNPNPHPLPLQGSTAQRAHAELLRHRTALRGPFREGQG